MNQEEGVQPLDTQDETRRIKSGEMLLQCFTAEQLS